VKALSSPNVMVRPGLKQRKGTRTYTETEEMNPGGGH